MSPLDLRAIFELSVAERIRLVEDIWDSIAASPESLPLTDAQKRELDRRWAEYQADPKAGRSWGEVRESLDRDSRDPGIWKDRR
jgi:putative addiction module component (TIGR02574 family)